MVLRSRSKRKKNPPISHTPSEPRITLQIFDVAGKRVEFHFVQRGTDTHLVGRRNLLKRLLGGSGEDDDPTILLFGGHQESRSRRAQRQPHRDGWRAIPLWWVSPRENQEVRCSRGGLRRQAQRARGSFVSLSAPGPALQPQEVRWYSVSSSCSQRTTSPASVNIPLRQSSPRRIGREVFWHRRAPW